MTIRRVAISSLNPAPYNPRVTLKPGDAEFESLRRSMGSFGCVEPLVWNSRTGHLVGGHQRLAVLRASGATETDVSVVDLPLAREKALNLALNRIQGRWDEDRLAELLRELIDLPEIELTGFGLDEAWGIVEGAMPEQGEGTDGFDVAAAIDAAKQRGAVTKPGDLIELGGKEGHRLLCGDCTEPATVRRLMSGERAALFATDPPYLVNYDGMNHPGKKRTSASTRTTRSARKPVGGGGGVGGGNKDWSGSYGVTWDDADANSDLYDRFVRVAVDEAIDPRAAWYCWHASKRQSLVERAWGAAGALVHCQIVWVKNRGVLTRTWYSWQHEPCLMGWLEGNCATVVEPSDEAFTGEGRVMRATIEERVLPEIGSGRPVVELIREIRDGTVSGRSLDSESRRACVAYLGAEGYGVPEIAAMLKVSDRTIARDRARVREDLAVERDPSLLPRTVGQLMAEAEASSVRLRRIARDRGTPAATRVEAEKATWGIVCDLVRLLQGLGYLPQAPRPIRASVRVGGLMGEEDDEFDAPALEELERELARIEAIAGGGAGGGREPTTGGAPEHHQEPNELAALRSDLGRLAVAARIAAVERLIATTTQGRDTDDQDEQQQQRRDESDEADERSEHQGRTRAPAQPQAHQRKAPARAASSLGSKGRSGTGRASRRRAG